MTTIVVDDIATRAIRGGQSPDPVTGAILTPIYQTTTFAQEAVGVDRGYTYSRAGNPTVSALERNLGVLEDAPPAVCFSTGIAAVAALILAVCRADDHVIIGDVIYGGTIRFLRDVLGPFGVRTSIVDTSDPQAVADAIQPWTKLIIIETPGNPTLKLTDIAAVARIAREAGVPLAVDNTFLTPAVQQPLELGADISVYSTTKFIEGHNSTVGGSIVARDERLLDRLRWMRKAVGFSQSPLDAWLTLRGVKTLPLRMQQHATNAQQIAEWLEVDPRVSYVNYPGLESFPQRELAQRQQVNGGGVISFEVEGGARTGRAFMNALELCYRAENVGAVETLVTHPATMTHAEVPRALREAAGITDGLVRLSVGLERPEDIIADIDQALDRAQEAD